MSETMMARTGLHLTDLHTLTLTFVASEDLYSVYRTAEGKTVYLAHGTAERLVDLDDLDLATEWYQYQTNSDPWSTPTLYGFKEMLAERIIEPDEAEEIQLCDDCAYLGHSDHFCWTGHETYVCDSCRDGYWFCVECEEIYRSTTTTLHGTEVCRGCRDNRYSHCEDCDGYHHDDNSEEHDHDSGCGCESPAQSFTVRNDGETPLSNDTRVTVTLPAGVISAVGIEEIGGYLRQFSYGLESAYDQDKLRAVSWRLDELGDRWQTREGNYTKRLSRFAYKEFSLKVAPELVSQVGCIARDHSTAVDFEIEVTRDLNLSAEEFCHEDSCWWQSYESSRCALKSNGGFGLRTFSDGPYSSVRGRAWVMPLRQNENGRLTPTFDTQDADAFVVFNGYGDLEGYAPARLVSHMFGMTYRKIGFSCDPMYINNDSGYLVAPEEIASNYTDGNLSLSVDHHASLFNTEMRELAHA